MRDIARQKRRADEPATPLSQFAEFAWERDLPSQRSRQRVYRSLFHESETGLPGNDPKNHLRVAVSYYLCEPLESDIHHSAEHTHSRFLSDNQYRPLRQSEAVGSPLWQSLHTR